MNGMNPVEILLVEDDQNDLDMTMRALQKANLANHIQVVRDGAEALDFIFSPDEDIKNEIKNRPKFILLDLKLRKWTEWRFWKKSRVTPGRRIFPSSC